MAFLPRLVTILVPIQCSIVLLAWAICAKLFNQKPMHGYEYISSRHSLGYWLAWLSTNLSWVLLLFPITWGIIATVRADTKYGGATLQPPDARLGWTTLIAVLVCAALAIFFTFECVFEPPNLVIWPDGLPP